MRFQSRGVQVGRAIFVIALLILFGWLPASTSISSVVVSLPTVDVTVNVTMGGAPVDARIVVVQNGATVKVAYTDVDQVGTAHLSLAPGDYTLKVDHGGGFTSTEKLERVTVRPDAALAVNVSLVREFEPNERSYYSADLHVHTVAYMSARTPIARAVGVQLAADLDLVFISDHDVVWVHDLFAATAQKRRIPYILSEEITTDTWGHFNAYSLNKGALVTWRGKTPSQIFQEARQKGAKIIQANHPFGANPADNYFAHLGEAEFDYSFDAIELFAGYACGAPLTAKQRQVFEFWNQGRRYVITGVSDAHDWETEEYGRARTYVFIEGELTMEKWIDSLKAQHAFATCGPLVYFTANEKNIPGDILIIKPRELVTFKAEIEGVTPLKKAEIIKNGRVAAEFKLSGKEAVVWWLDAPTSNSWYVLHVIAEDEDRALTNPIWVEVRK